jgi:hypothetical protein
MPRLFSFSLLQTSVYHHRDPTVWSRREQNGAVNQILGFKDLPIGRLYNVLHTLNMVQGLFQFRRIASLW